MPQSRFSDQRATRTSAALSIAALAIGMTLVACANAQTAAPERGRALLEKAERSGSLPVIVRLAVPFRPERSLDPAGARAQRDEIRRAQAHLVTELRPFDARVVTRYATVPLIALVVDTEALRHLLRSKLVRSIQENRPELPS